MFELLQFRSGPCQYISIVSGSGQCMCGVSNIGNARKIVTIQLNTIIGVI